MNNYFHKFRLFDLGFLIITILVLLLNLSVTTTCVRGESSTCLMVYKEGGAPAVFKSPKCPQWTLPDFTSKSRSKSPVATCQTAVHQGRRKSQEDRVFCNIDVRIPFPGPAGITEVTVGVAAVFDGHNGAEASEMASKLLLEYFTLHTYFILDTMLSVLSRKSIGKLPKKGEHFHASQTCNWNEELGQHVLNFGRFTLTLGAFLDGSFHLEILKESLLRAIDDIDATFSKEASRNNFDSGSTATVVLVADGHILVANVGDSKALLCSEIFQSPLEAKATLLRLYRQKRSEGARQSIKKFGSYKLETSNGFAHFSVVELTKDHHPDRLDERSRVESAGGYVLEWAGVSRVNGQLAVSRAIGDLPFKSYGVVSIPEVTDWRPLTANDSYLVAASDGVFEKLSPQDVCDLLWELQTHGPRSSSCVYSLADCIVDTAFQKGSTDNMAAVVVPFRSTGFFEPLLQEKYDEQWKFHSAVLGLQKYSNEQPELELSHPIIGKFDRLLVEGKGSSFETFYLSENLNEYDDYTFWVQRDDQEYMHEKFQALPDALNYSCGRYLNLYSDQNMCLRFGMTTDGYKDQCIHPDGFANLLGLLESLPISNIGSDYGSNQYSAPDSRYILKKRFDRGSFGEVWLAFNWNSSLGTNASSWSSENIRFPFSTLDLGPCGNSSHSSSSAHSCNGGLADDGMFILKRIMAVLDEGWMCPKCLLDSSHTTLKIWARDTTIYTSKKFTLIPCVQDKNQREVERGTAVYLSGLREKYFGEVFLNASKFLGSSLSAVIANSFSKELQSNLYGMLKANESDAPVNGPTWDFKKTFSQKNRLQRDEYEEGLSHIARYIESFESRSNEIWLVFRHEGVSLSKLMYTAEEVGSDGPEEHVKRVQVLHPSKWWHRLRTTEAGHKEMRTLMWHLLMALKSCHDRNITHRDIKPENMVICFEDLDSGRCLKGSPSGDQNYTIKMRIIDFGSAIDEYTVNHLYSSQGPSRAEQTYEYTPPEALLNASWYRGTTNSVLKYDMWSVGIVFLELILGSPNVFQLNSLSRVLLDQHLEGWNDDLKKLAYKLRSLMEMCILVPGSSSKHQRTWGANDGAAVSPASWKCSEEFFSLQIKSKDPLKIGFPNVWALRLVRQLLLWDPEDRLSVDDALRHPYFSSNFEVHSGTQI